MRKIEFILKHNAIAQKIYVIVFSVFFKFIGLFIKTDKKLVLFQSMIGKNYGDSPKVIFDAMKKDETFAGYKYIWAFDDPNKFQVEGAELVNINSLNYFLTALRAGIWVTNVNIERNLHFKPKNTISINTWHGCAPLKVDGNAQKNRNDYNFSDIDIMCSNSKWQDGCFTTFYKVKKENIIRCGMPRNDTLFDTTETEIELLRKKYKIPENKKIILYAPTWRDSYNKGKSYDIAPPINISYWERELSNEYIILFRMHHLTNRAMNIQFNEFVYDFSGDYDINELMKISNILITDYSSILTDYSILERPALLFTYDYDEFEKYRGFYIKPETVLPGCVCKTEEELIDHIHNMNYYEERKKIKALKEKYVYCENKSTEICVNAIKERITV